MREMLFPAILAAVGYVGLGNTDKMVDLYRAAYPNDPQKAQALERCATLYPNFNRLDSADRATCFADGYRSRPAPAVATAMGRGPAPAYEFSPSHLPGNDIRRQQANEAYVTPPSLPVLAPTPAMAMPAPPVPLVRPVLPPAAAQHSEPAKHPARRYPATQQTATYPSYQQAR